MRNTKMVVILSVVATILVLGISFCIVLNPLVEVGIVPVLLAVSLIISAIGGVPDVIRQEHPKEGNDHVEGDDHVQDPPGPGGDTD